MYSSWSSVRLLAVSSQSTLNGQSFTHTLLDIDPLVVATIDVAIEHGLEIGIVSLVARSLVINGVGEESVEAEADQEGLADLDERGSTSELE